MSEVVPLPNVQPPTLTSQTERHKTSRSQLSSSLDSSHTLRRTFLRLPSDTCFDTCSALSWGCVRSSSPLRHNIALRQQETHLVSRSSGLRRAPSPVSDAWCEAADGSTRSRELGDPQPCPQKAADVTEEERRRKKHNLPDPSFPHLGEQYPASSWRGSAFVSLPTLPLKSQEQTDALTH